MSCFIGLSVQQDIDAPSYQLALSQMLDYASQTNYKIVSHPHLLILACRYQKFCLPKNSDYLHSNLQHFVISQEDDEQYIQTIVECLIILKEHLPHKIHIQMISKVELIFNLKNKADEEVPRRLINHLKIIQEKSKKGGLSEGEVHMLISNLSAEFHKDYQQKLKSLSLKILSQSKVSSKIWNSLSKQQIKVIDQIVNDPTYQKMGIEILQRIVRNNEYKVISFLDQKQNNEPNQLLNNAMQQQLVPDYQGPLDPMTALFQLRQSLNISRVSWIIQNINCDKLQEKKLTKFDTRIKEVAYKFLQGLFDESPINHTKNFGKVLSQYEMRRGKTKWDGLVEQVLIKIEDMQKQKGKRKPSPKSWVTNVKS